MPYGSKKNPGRVAGGAKRAANASATFLSTMLSVAAQNPGRAHSPATESVAMTSGVAHGRESPSSSDGQIAASQTSRQASASNMRQMPFNTSCDRASPALAVPGSSASAASIKNAKPSARAMRRDTAAANAALAAQQSVLATQIVASNTGCGIATIAASSPATTILSREAARDLLWTISCQWEAVGLVLRLHPRLCELQHVHSCERASQLGQLRQMRQSCAAFPPG
jgi:hypothetical protein